MANTVASFRKSGETNTCEITSWGMCASARRGTASATAPPMSAPATTNAPTKRVARRDIRACRCIVEPPRAAMESFSIRAGRRVAPVVGARISGGMAGVQPAHLLEAELRAAGVRGTGVRDPDQLPFVIAAVEAVEDRPCEPVAAVEHRDAMGPGGPTAAREL